MTILVCGGAGYIGSHVTRALIDSGEDVIVLDNLQTGHVDAVHEKAKLVLGDLRDNEFMEKVFKDNKIDGVIDFAAFSLARYSFVFVLPYFWEIRLTNTSVASSSPSNTVVT